MAFVGTFKVQSHISVPYQSLSLIISDDYSQISVTNQRSFSISVGGYTLAPVLSTGLVFRYEFLYSRIYRRTRMFKKKRKEAVFTKLGGNGK
jgi:hypothetical protein